MRIRQPFDLVRVLRTPGEGLQQVGAFVLLSSQAGFREIYDALQSELPFLVGAPFEHGAKESIRDPVKNNSHNFLFRQRFSRCRTKTRESLNGFIEGTSIQLREAIALQYISRVN